MQATTEEKLDFKKILPIFVIVLVDLLGLTIIIPLLPVYAATFGADPFTIGLLVAAYPLLQLVGGPVLGGLSDRFGRKPVLVVSQIGTLIGFLILAFANALSLLFLSRLLDGFTGGNIVTAQAAITDSTTDRTRAQGLGMIGAAFGLGFVAGPIIASVSLALTNNNYQVPALIAAGFSLLSIILTSLWFEETLPADQRGQRNATGNLLGNIVRAVQSPQVGALLLLTFFQRLVFGGFEALLVLFNLSRVGLDAAGNGIVFAFVGVILVAVQGKFIGPWSRRFGEHRLIYAGLALVALGLILTALTPEVPVPWYSPETILESTNSIGEGQVEVSVPLPDATNGGWLGFIWLLVAMIPAAIGGGILSPSINSLITQRTTKSEIGGTLGVSTSLVSLANAITPLVGGLLFQQLGSTAPFLLGGIVMVLLCGISLRIVQPANTLEPVST